MKPRGVNSHKAFFFFLTALLFTVLFLSVSSEVLAQVTLENDPEFFMGILILESQQQAILDSIKKVKDLQLGNMVILHPMDQAWNLTLIEDSIREANDLGLYTIFETYDTSDHHVRISPEQFATWKAKYPLLLGILVQEITGKQVDMNLWADNSTGTIKTRLQAEQAVIENLTTTMRLPEFKENDARIFLAENVISYASANTSYCDVFISKVFNAPNAELMIGLARGMVNSYNIPAWGLWVDTWREWVEPPADFTPNDVERALYEGWFYGAKYFFFEQGNFFGTLNRDWPKKHIILGQDGKLTEYGRVLQRFYAFLQNGESIGYDQPNYSSSIAVMIGQSGWSSRGPDWGLWLQSDRYGDFDYRLLNLFFPGIGDNWQIGSALIAKEFTGLPFGMVDVISIYAPPSVLKQYKVIIALGWSQMSDTIASNIEDYVQNGGIFFSFLTFTHTSETVDNLEDPNAWTKSLVSLFGVHVPTHMDSNSDVTVDTFLHNIEFTQDTFWYPWNGKTYRYFDPAETGSWFWRFKYDIFSGENTRVIAWVDGDQSWPNAFIIENKKGTGYIYVVNTRNPNSLPNGVLTDVITDFIYYLCAYYVRPMSYIPYPENEYWLSQGQTDRVAYLMHDNSTTPQTFTYYIRPLDADLDPNKEYIVFDYFNNEFYGIEKGLISLGVTLQPSEGKLFTLLEKTGEPQIIYSDTHLTAAPFFTDQRLTVALKALEEATNMTKIYCADFERPRYILGTPFNITQNYDTENKILTVVSNSDITVSWENRTDFYVISSNVSLTEFSWNSSLKLLRLSANGTDGQEGSLQMQTGESTPYYLKVNGEEISTWSFDASTGVFSANFSFPSEMIELIVGFAPIEIDQALVSDTRADVDSSQTVSFHLMWMSDGSDVTGASVDVDGVKYSTNKTGWISFDTTYDNVGRVVWNVTGVTYNSVTDYVKSVSDPYIIWDRVNVVDSISFDEIVQAGSSQLVWLKAEYEYDSVSFDDSKGTLLLNGEPMAWSEQNSRWEYNATSNILGPQVYEVTWVNDRTFNLTTIHSQAEEINIIWDKIEISKMEFETGTLGMTKVKVYATYNYTKNPVVNADVTVNGETCNEIESGVYMCELTVWVPIQGFLVEVESPDFEQATKNVLNLHASNTVLYVLIGLAIVLPVAFVVLRKKRKRQKREPASSGTSSNARLLSILNLGT